MKKDNLLSAVCLVGILALCFPLVARADSSWVWITETRPYDVLPFVVVGTLLIETLSIWLIPHTRRLSKVFWVVCLGNGLSYAAPYCKKKTTSSASGKKKPQAMDKNKTPC